MRMRKEYVFATTCLVWLATAIVLPAQMPAPPAAAALPLRSGAELEQMLGPIALYPDPLIAQILPASTLPAEVVLAQRYVSGGGAPNLIDQHPINFIRRIKN